MKSDCYNLFCGSLFGEIVFYADCTGRELPDIKRRENDAFFG